MTLTWFYLLLIVDTAAAVWLQVPLPLAVLGGLVVGALMYMWRKRPVYYEVRGFAFISRGRQRGGTGRWCRRGSRGCARRGQAGG